MIYTITFNPSLDYIIRVDHFKTGTINKTHYENILPGGKGINVAIVLNNLKHESCALGFIAGYTGQNIQTLLTQRNINHQFIEVENSLSRINIKMNADHIETEINGIGPNIMPHHVDQLFKQLDQMNDNDLLVISGSVPPCLSDNIYEQILNRYQNKNIKIVVDANKDLLLNCLKYQPFLIKPNHHELGALFNTEITTKQQAITYAKKLQELGAKNVLVSMASKGAVLVDEYHNIYQANSLKGDVVNSVGAGDSMVAGFIAGYLETNNYYDALIKGIACGCASTFSSDLATYDVVEQYTYLLNQYK